MAHLISYYTQIDPNLRRTASKGLISLLNQEQLEELSFKHFSCINKDTGEIGYQCPYTGIEFYDYDDIILEHIIPVSSMGGTVLFNCIPAYKGINSADQKGANHLLDWWKNKGKQYYNPERLDKLLSYIFDAYDIVFSNHTIEEIENSYEDIDLDENVFREYDNIGENDDNPEDITELSKEDEELKKQAKKTGIISYLGFINDCIRELKANNYDTTKYEEKLREYEEYGYFENIERYTLFQNTIKDIIENMLGDKKNGLLSYTINFNISKLMDSMKEYKTQEEIKNELEKRLNNIERILIKNNLSILEYFKSLIDIQDIDILYKNNISSDELQTFIENIKIGLDTKIDIFINMLADENKTYTSYENGEPDDKNIFKTLNTISFEGYENINTSDFWHHNSLKIKTRLAYLEKNAKTDEERKKYQIVRRAIEEYEFQCKDSGLISRIDCYIEMLTDKQYTSYENGIANSNNIFKARNTIPFKGYENINGLNTSKFWNSHSDEIKARLTYLEKNAKTDEERKKYQIVRRAIEEYIFTTNIEQRIDCYIEMLTDKRYTSYEKRNPSDFNIFKEENAIPFQGFESINGLNTSYFWNKHSPEIKTRLAYLEKNAKTDEERKKYQIARRAIEDYEFQSLDSGLMLRIDCYIEMLNDKQYTTYEKGVPNDNNIFKARNEIPFKGYENISGLNTSHFWNTNSLEIKTRLAYLEKNAKTDEERKKYQIARRAIEDYIFTTNIEQRIDCYIEMLNDKQYTTYEKGVPNENNIFKKGNTIPFKGYESINGLNTSHFWLTNSQKKIIPMLFFNKRYDDNKKEYVDSEKDYSGVEYDTARNAVLEYLKVKDIHEYIDKLEKKEKKTAKVLELINLRNSLRKTAELLRMQKSKLVAENKRLHDEYIETHRYVETRRTL